MMQLVPGDHHVCARALAEDSMLAVFLYLHDAFTLDVLFRTCSETEVV